ncbi:MAG: response regulator transcription factor [Proteobacteria bacterium]|jgi:DNA-binding response OmpR family regulator|nr:response regulator transcription factor [Alphaproteobacteria bacterium]NCC04150.1 response regulator transcription factor [Pseudomonadota bacterium]
MLFLGLISPDAALCHALSEQLKQGNAWQSAQFSSPEDALAAWSASLPPLIFWDAQMAPINDEMANFFAMRLDQMTPTSILLVLGEAPERLEKDYVTERFQRPLRLGYLLTRLQFYQRVVQQAPDVTLTLGPWSFSPRTRKLFRDGQGDPVKLTDKESSLLEYLYAVETPVSREELLGAIWGYDTSIDTHTLETHIYRLRRKLMEGGDDLPDVFATEEGDGYQIHPSWRS